MTTDDREKIKVLIDTVWHPSRINKGASNILNRDLISLTINEAFIDEPYADWPALQDAINEYIDNKSIIILGPNFGKSDPDNFAKKSVVVEWLNEEASNANLKNNKKLFELLLRVSRSKNEVVNYLSYDEQEKLSLTSFSMNDNDGHFLSTIAETKIAETVRDAIKNKDMASLFSDTFLGKIIDIGYDYESFKKMVSDNISNGLLSETLGSQVTLSEKFLGLNGSSATENALAYAGSVFTFGVTLLAVQDYKGPLGLVESGDGYSLRRNYPSIGVNSSVQIPSSKIEKFKEVTQWETRTSMFKKTRGSDVDSTVNFSNESIDKFALAIKSKDLTENKFEYYTGEYYDSWNVIFDVDFWGDAVVGWADIVSNELIEWFDYSDPEDSNVDPQADVIPTRVWRGQILKKFDAESDAPLNLEGPMEFSTDAALLGASSLAAKYGIPKVSAAAIKYIIVNSEVVMTATGTPDFLISASAAKRIRILRYLKAAPLKAAAGVAAALLNVAMLATFAYSLATTKDISHAEILEREILNQYIHALNDSIEALASNERVGQTIRDAAADETFLNRVLSIFAIDKEVERRVRLFNRMAFELNRDENFLDEGNEDAIAAAIADSNGRAFADIDLPEIEELTDEEIADRQRFYKQCALMMNMHLFAPKYEEKVKQRINGDGKPFDGRFWRVTSKNKERLLNNMFSSKDSQYFFEAPTHVVTQLTPKLRLYKVFNEDDGKLTRTEFIFPTHTDLSRKKNFATNQTQTIEVATEKIVPSFFESSFDKGDGMGLKSFTLEFNGTNPAEARNDVKGTMVLFFQSFADFVRERVSTNGKKFRFVDLIIHPKPAPDGSVQGNKIVSKRQYEPEFYRIMAEVGYIPPTDFQGLGGDKTALMNAVNNTNKSYYLTMVDHDFSINNDGTVQVTLTYRAYIESALKSLKFDALTTPELAQKRIENQTKLAEVASKRVCTEDELRDIKILLSAIEEEVLKDSLNSIMKRLFDRGKVFNVNISNEDRKFFLKNGYYNKCDITGAVDLNSSENRNSGDLGIVLNTELPENSEDYNFADADENDTLVQFFFFGDLLHTILDAMYDPNFGNRLSIGMENTKIVLGSFDFETFHNSSTTTKNDFNISQIPISVEFFSRWFVDNVLSQKSTRRSFPILNFIRNLSNSLVSNSLLELCVNRDIESRLIFQTAQMSAYREGGDLIGQLTHADAMIVDTDVHRGSTVLPLEGNAAGDSKIENFHHYMILNPNGSTRSHGGTGIYGEDVNAGVYHIEIGSNRGIVKTVNFSKTDQQYLREARFMRRGVDGLMQLGSVYNVDIEMYGNSIFYPGMDIWLNPFGFGGASLGRPQTGGEARSLANILGIGGYHTITSVSMNLSPGSFTTNLKAMYYYSGDGELDYLTPQQNLLSKTDEQIIEEFAVEGNSQADAAAEACRVEIVNLQNFRDPEQQIEPTVEEPPPVPTINEALGESSADENLTINEALGESDG